MPAPKYYNETFISMASGLTMVVIQLLTEGKVSSSGLVCALINDHLVIFQEL